MASASLTPYKNNTTQETFSLVTQSTTGATYKVAGRSLGLPFSVSINRKIGNSSAASNDVVEVTVSRTQNNADGLLATGYAKLSISIPRKTDIVSQANMLEILGVMGSLLNDSVALQATTAARTALLEGRDL